MPLTIASWPGRWQMEKFIASVLYDSDSDRKASDGFKRYAAQGVLKSLRYNV